MNLVLDNLTPDSFFLQYLKNLDWVYSANIKFNPEDLMPMLYINEHPLRGIEYLDLDVTTKEEKQMDLHEDSIKYFWDLQNAMNNNRKVILSNGFPAIEVNDQEELDVIRKNVVLLMDNYKHSIKQWGNKETTWGVKTSFHDVTFNNKKYILKVIYNYRHNVDKHYISIFFKNN